MKIYLFFWLSQKVVTLHPAWRAMLAKERSSRKELNESNVEEMGHYRQEMPLLLKGREQDTGNLKGGRILHLCHIYLV